MFDRNRVKLLRAQLEAHLEELAEKLNVNITLGSARFTASNVSFKMEVAKIGKDGEVENRAVTSFRAMAPMYGLKPDDLHRTFVMDGKTYKVVGLNTRRSKYPVLAECNGKQYRISASMVKLYLNS